MVPNINTRGHSFKGVTVYLMHDKGASTSSRVAWTSTHNLFTDDVNTAAKVMAWTDMHRDDIRAEAGGSAAGRKPTKGSVYHYSLSWKDGQDPSREDMEAAAHASVERLGLEGHQYYLVAHNDTEHAHVHIVTNLVNPETGLIHSNYRDQKILDRWAHEYEQEHGIVCEARAQKYQAWEQDRKAFSEKERRQDYADKVTAAFYQSDSAKSFAAALEQDGLSLAQGNRRGFVFVDERGKVYALNRLIRFEDDLKAADKNKAITERLKGIERDALPVADVLAEKRKAQYQQRQQAQEEAAQQAEIWDRDQAEAEAQSRLADAAIAHAKEEANRLAQEKAKAAKDAHERREAENAAHFQKQQHERFEAYQRRIDERVSQSRERWEIDDLIRRRDEAAAAIPEIDGFWSRVFRKGEHEAACDHLQDMEKRLAERMGRFDDDIRAIYRNRPQWVIDKELEKQGIADGSVRSASSPQPERAEGPATRQQQAPPAPKEQEAQKRDSEARHSSESVTEKANKVELSDETPQDLEWGQKQWNVAQDQQNPETGLSQSWDPAKEEGQQQRLEGWLSREWEPGSDHEQDLDRDGPEIER